MTFLRLLCFAALFLPFLVSAQKIQYSRQTVPHSSADETQLVANVDGFHHLIRFRINRKPVVHIFTPQLEYTAKVEVDFAVKEGSEVNVIPMQNFYFLYFHVPGSTAHHIFKINGGGEVLNQTPSLQKLMDTVVPPSTVTYQLQNQNNQLVLLSHTYYDALKQVGTTVVALNENMQAVSSSKVFYPFEKGREYLQQVLLRSGYLLVLKAGIGDEKSNFLEVVKADIGSDSSLTTTLNSTSYNYYNAAIHYSSKDSGIVVHAQLREPFNAVNRQRATLVTRMNHLLHLKKPVTIFRAPQRRNIIAGFLLLNKSGPWITLPVSTVTVGRNTRLPRVFRETNSQSFTLVESFRRIYQSEIRYGQPSAVSFTVLDEEDKLASDTVVENSGSYFDLQPRPFAQLTIDGKPHLLFIQNFSAKQSGLLLFSTNENGNVSSKPIPVYGRYEYFLPQTQAQKDYFILPYQYKNEIGLVKITHRE